MSLGLFGTKIVQTADALAAEIANLPTDQAVTVLNEVRQRLHAVSPHKHEPVDCVIWVPAESVRSNTYNPNNVAPPEMALLAHSITADGYTQPIVAWKDGAEYEVVDGFHRNRVGKEVPEVRNRVRGYLPLTIANDSRLDKSDRIAATIRHNRARGKHRVEAMSDIIVELKRRNWTDEKIGKELGMEPDEVLRLCQISGLAEMFADHDFSKAWEIGEHEVDEIAFEITEGEAATE